MGYPISNFGAGLLSTRSRELSPPKETLAISLTASHRHSIHSQVELGVRSDRNHGLSEVTPYLRNSDPFRNKNLTNTEPRSQGPGQQSQVNVPKPALELFLKQLAAGNEAGWGHDCYTAIGIQRGGMLRQCFVGMVVARLFGLH